MWKENKHLAYSKCLNHACTAGTEVDIDALTIYNENIMSNVIESEAQLQGDRV